MVSQVDNLFYISIDHHMITYSIWEPLGASLGVFNFLRKNITQLKKLIIFVLHQLWYLGHTFFGAADRGHLSTRRLGSYRPNFFLKVIV